MGRAPRLRLMAALDDLEARVSALEASQADYRAVLAAVNALGANQRDHAERLGRVEKRLDSVDSQLTSVESKLDDTNAQASVQLGWPKPSCPGSPVSIAQQKSLSKKLVEQQ